jgi:hypothetical protein
VVVQAALAPTIRILMVKDLAAAAWALETMQTPNPASAAVFE